MEIRILRKQGKSLRAIAGEVGVSANTVRKYLTDDQVPRYKRRAAKASKLEPFMGYLRERVEAAQPHWIPATVLCREVREQGFTGCERLVRNFVRGLKPVKAEEPLVRFETAPGQQMQVDWIEFKRDGLSAFVATLGHSRASYVEYVTDERIETLVACHIHAFEFFGGVPRDVLYDNMKTVVIERDAYGEGKHRFHPTLWDLPDRQSAAGAQYHCHSLADQTHPDRYPKLADRPALKPDCYGQPEKAPKIEISKVPLEDQGCATSCHPVRKHCSRSWLSAPP